MPVLVSRLDALRIREALLMIASLFGGRLLMSSFLVSYISPLSDILSHHIG